MDNKRKSSKGLLVGIIGAVVILAAVLVLLLTQCTGGQNAPGPAATTAAQQAAESYTLYWNLDRAEYDGKSEAGMSSRMPESDGYFHVRLFCDGEEITLKATDRKVINKLDNMSLFGLVLDEQGLITEVLELDELPLELTGWGFYVQSVGGNALKLNSSDTFSGMELLLDTSSAKIYDMTGVSGPMGSESTPIAYDRVYPISNTEGELTHLFLYDRTHFMLASEAECQHCKEKVQWNEWTRGDAFPTKPGHYKLMTDVQMPGQISFANDVKICLDLNGHTVTGKTNTRLVSLHNPGTSFALMDTSEAQTGRMVGHSTASPQGGIVWVRYGQFHMYGGTLDGSDMVSRLNGTVVQVPKNAFFYMYGGEIIGGTAQPQRVETASSGYGYGIGGALQVAGTFRMYGGTIRDGKAPAAYYYNNKGKLTLARGMGGNVFLSSGAVMEMTGGKILNGFAGNVGGNIMMDGTAELTISGGEISGGRLEGRIAGKNGANIYCPSKGKVIMTGGVISGGRATNGGGGNIYLCGKMTMSNASILGGYAGQRGGNILMAGNAKLYMDRGAVIGDGVCNGTAAGHGGGNICMGTDNSELVMVGGTIRDGHAKGKVGEDGVLLGGDGGNINLNKGLAVLRGGYVVEGKAEGNGGGIYVGWNARGVQLDQKIQIYDNEGADIIRSNNTASVKSQILLGSWQGNAEAVGAPVVGRLSGIAGRLVISPAKDKTIEAADLAKFASNSQVLPLMLKENGTIVYGKPDLGEPDHLHCLCAGKLSGHTCADTGFVSVDGATFDQCWSVGTTADSLMGSLNMCLTEDITISTEHVIAGNTLNLCLHGHTITMEGNARITANGTSGVLNITDCTGGGKIVAAENCRASFLYTYKGQLNLYGGTVDASGLGVGFGALRVGYAGDVINMYGGTVIGSKNATNGGSVYLGTAGTFNLYGGTIRDGVASSGGGGNIFITHDDAVVNIYGGTIRGGVATNTKKGYGLGGNIHVVRGTLNISGGTITGGSAKGLTDDGEPVGITGGVYAAYNAKPFTLSGNAKIYGNTGSDIWLTSKASYMVTLGDWNGNGSYGALAIGKTGSAVGTQLVNGVQKADMGKFATVRDDLVLKHTGSKIILATPFVHEHCICQGTLAHTCQNVSFIEVANAGEFKNLFDSNGALLESVNVALNGSFTLDKEYKTAGKTLNLCLNGQTITMSGNARLTANGSGELNITDCGSGKIVTAAGCRHSVLYVYEGTMNLYAGTVDASAIVLKKTDTNKSGGVVNVYNTGTAFHMYGGEIIGATIYRGGAVYAYKGLFHMHGGRISGGNATVGGGVATDQGTFLMDGGVITGNTADTNGAGVFLGYQSSSKFTLADDAKIYGNTGANDIYAGQKVAANRVLVLDGWKGNGANGAAVIACNGAANGTVMATAKEGVLTETELGMLASGHDGLELKVVDGKIVLATPFVHKHCICANALVHSCEELSFIEVKTKADFDALFNESKELTSSVNIALTGSFTLDAEYKTEGKTLNLCLNGQTITMSGNARLTANGSGELNITDCDSGEIVAAAGCRHSFLYVYEGTMNLYAGTVNASAIVLKKTDTNKSGGAVNVYNTGTAFHMYGGEIIGATIYRGGAVYAYKGLFHMHGGRISGGNTDVGGGVATDQGTFLMDGGVITGNTADTNGAAVFLGYNSKTTLTISGDAKIYGNTGANDIWIGQKPANNVNYLILDGWDGNGTNGPICINRNASATDPVVAVAKTGELDKTMLKNFTYPGDELQLVLSEGKIVLAPCHKHCICAGKVSGHSCTDVKFVDIATAEEFSALFAYDTDKKAYLLKESVSIALTGSFTLESEYATNGHTLTICLNGNTITMAGSARITTNGTTGVLNITDCGSGKIEAAEGAATSFLYTYKGNLNIYGGTVDATKTAAAAGGAIRVSQPGDELNIYGGTIIGSKKGTIGGTIYVTNSGTINIHGGTIRDGVATNYGGNIGMTKGTLNVFGGIVTGGQGVNGGNIQAGGDDVEINIYGGTISNGTATGVGTATGLGGNIHIVKGTLNISGGNITGGTSKGAADENNPVGATGGIYLAYNAKTFTLSGNAKIHDNNGSDIWLSSKASYMINVDGWAGNGSSGALVVGKNNAADGTQIASGKTALTEADLTKFTSAYEDLKLVLNADGKIVLEKVLYHEHCLCNGKYTGHTCSDVRFAEVTGTDDFLALFDADRKLIDSVSVYLNCDVELSAEYSTNGKTLSICLNGHTIDLKTGGRLTANGNTGVLNITDCGDGEIVGASYSFLYGYNGDINLYSGTVNASAIKLSMSDGKYGGAVYASKTGDTFTMYGGTILGGQLERGGAAFAQYGSIIIRDGLITGGKTKYGGGVGVNFGTFEMTGGEITDNNATTNGAGVFLGYNMTTKGILGGDAAIYGNTGCEDVRLGQQAADNNRFVLDGWTGCGDGKTMTLSSVSGKADAVVAEAKTGTVSESLLAFLGSYDADYTLVLNTDGQVAMKKLHRHCVCDGKVSGNDTHTCKKLVYTEVNAAQFLELFGTNKVLTADHNVVLTENVTLTAEYWTNGHTLNLCLGDKTITMGANGRLTKNGTDGAGELNITACGGGGIVVAADGKSSSVYVQNGPLNMYSGTINASALTTSGNGGAVYVNLATASFNMYGGTVTAAASAKQGGAIYVENGKVVLHNGTIVGGTAVNGGAIQLNFGDIEINNGTIYGGTVTGRGGAIYTVDPGSDIVMNGGLISGGSANLGGCISVNKGTFTMSGGVITGGSLTGSNATGAGVNIQYNVSKPVVISGNAKIYGNNGADIHLGQKSNPFITLDTAWTGNGETPMVISRGTETVGTAVVVAKEGSLTDGVLANFKYLNDKFALAISSGKIVINEK